MRALQDLGFLLVIVTNQSGVARGYLTEADLSRMHAHLTDRLARNGVLVEDVYFCPHHPEGVVSNLAVACDCRKPAPGMVVRAALEHDLRLNRCWLVGDILDDVEAGNRAGCRTVLVDLGTEASPTMALRRPDVVARDTCHALQIIQAVEGLAGPSDLSYRPSGWEPLWSPVAAGSTHG
jgi:D-glycero-D-manno-heptose 1,7-bisphosphate phosphatase